MTVLRNKIALALSEPFTADESRKAGKDRSGSKYVLADRVLALLVDDSADRAGVLFAELTAVREELKAVKGNRLVSAVFAMPQGQPHPKVFALYRAGDGQVAMGVQFPDQAIVLRWASNDEHPGTTVINERPTGTVEHLLGDDRTQVVWLSEELEPLAQQEKRAEEAEAQLEAAQNLWWLAKSTMGIRRVEHNLMVYPRPKMDAPGLFGGICTCGDWESAPGSVREVASSWEQHQEAKTSVDSG